MRTCKRAVPEETNIAVSLQLVEQLFPRLQIGRVESLGEPAVDVSQHLTGFFLLARSPKDFEVIAELEAILEERKKER